MTPTPTLSVSEAAQRLGVSIDAVRTYENAGRLRAERSPGGHRRFTAVEIDRFKADAARENAKTYGHDDDAELEDEDDELPSARRSRRPPVSEWKSRTKNALADVEVAKANRDRRRIEVEDQRERDRLEQEATAAQTRKAEAQRLAELRQYGRSQATYAGVPTELRGKIVEDLETWVTGRRIPADLTKTEAEELVRARVERWVKPWREKREQREADKHRASLDAILVSGKISTGLSYADSETWDWHADDRGQARRAVKRALEEEVDESWSTDDIETLVDDVLEEWED